MKIVTSRLLILVTCHSPLILSYLPSRTTCAKTVFAQNRTSNLRFKWNCIVSSAVITDHFKTLLCILSFARFFWAAFRTTLRRHHVPLVKDLLLFFRKNKNFLTLNTSNFYFWHIPFLLPPPKTVS